MASCEDLLESEISAKHTTLASSWGYFKQNTIGHYDNGGAHSTYIYLTVEAGTTP